MTEELRAVVVPKELYYHEVAYVRGLEAEVKRLTAQSAELNHRLDIAEEERHARRGQLERLREAKDTFFQNAEAWEAKYNDAKAEKEGWYDMYMMAKNETGQANAEIARLREALKPFAEAAEEYDELDEDSQCIWGASFNTLGDLRRAAAALKPDTGENFNPQDNRWYGPSALKPDTGETP